MKANNVIMFVKPMQDDTCIVLAFMKDSKVYIHDAYIDDGILDCNERMKQLLARKDKDYPIEKIIYDASLYKQEGAKIRESGKVNIYMYSNKNTFEYRLVNQSDYIRSFIFRKNKSDSYNQFVNMYEIYSKDDKYNIAVDILCDISRYYRTRNGS